MIFGICELVLCELKKTLAVWFDDHQRIENCEVELYANSAVFVKLNFSVALENIGKIGKIILAFGVIQR